MDGFQLEKGHFGRYSALSDAEKLLEKKRVDALAAVGKEADHVQLYVGQVRKNRATGKRNRRERAGRRDLRKGGG